jgi:hypothetical protein
VILADISDFQFSEFFNMVSSQQPYGVAAKGNGLAFRGLPLAATEASDVSFTLAPASFECPRTGFLCVKGSGR